MKDFVSHIRAAGLALAVAVLALLPSEGALAQLVTTQPTYINPGTATDLGNGPADIQLKTGNALFATSSGSGVGQTSGATAQTTVTLTATPTTVPCVGCLLSASALESTTVTIPSGAFITAFNGGLSVTMSTNVTIGTGATLAWGAACPASPPVGIVLPIQASVGGDTPFYTQARLCAYSPNGPGAAALLFPIGAH